MIIRGGNEMEEIPEKIKVIGIGKVGINAVKNLAASEKDFIDFITIDTDEDEVSDRPGPLADADLVVLVCDARIAIAPIVAKRARELGALTLAIVTRPLKSEGKDNMILADEGITKLKGSANATIVVDWDEINMHSRNGGGGVDDYLKWSVKGVTDLLTKTNLVCMDFFDMKAIFSNMGLAGIGIGVACGVDKYLEAARRALDSPMVKRYTKTTGLAAVKANTSDENALLKIIDSTSFLQEALNTEANTIFAGIIEEGVGDKVYATVIASAEINNEILSGNGICRRGE